MSLVTLADYKSALGITGTDENTKITQYSLEIDDRVKSYLGYDTEETEYSQELYDGSGTNTLIPRNIPVTTITTLEVYEGLDSDGNEDWETWTQNDEYTRLIIRDGGMVIHIDGACFPEGEQNIRLTYTAGYDSDTLPQDIQAVCKELMILKYRNIDKEVMGKSSASIGMGSNTSDTYEFNEDDILKKIEHYRIVRI